MGYLLKANEINQIKKGTVLFRQGEKISLIGMIVKGSILIRNESMKRKAEAGEIIGAADLFAEEYLSSYATGEDTIFYAFAVSNEDSLETFLASNAGYRGIIVDSMAKELAQYIEVREFLLNRAAELHRFLKKHYEAAVREGMGEEVPEEFLKEHPEEIFCLEYDEHKLTYYKELNKIPSEKKKQFYGSNETVAFYQAEEIAYVTKDIQKSSGEILKYLKELYEYFINKEATGLFDKEVRFAKEMQRIGKFEKEQFIRINQTKEKICALQEFIKKRTGEELPLDLKNMEEKMKAVLNAETQTAEEEKIENTEVLEHSLRQILTFAKVTAEEGKKITAAIDSFVKVSDRLSTQDDVRKLKKQLTSYFFDLYKKCLFRWFEQPQTPVAVRLFLNYGYMDERLLEKEQLIFLCDMLNEKGEDLPCKVYRLPEWFKEIYEGRKETSRNAFEQDYRDVLREQKRTGDITEKQEKEYLADNGRKVLFEVDNMFVNNNKIVNGKLSTYTPVLYKDQFYGDIERLYLTKKQLSDAIIELEKKDFTVFFREVLYTNPELKIDKEYVMKHVYPDVILLPVYGTTCSMWQEITGKRRDTPARFLFSVLTETEVEKSVTKAFGRFHWEYCRCEQGAAWNNIQYKSLTSEYMDYIQYYRKNHDLSEEKREKIRSQIQKARNNSREIFVSDYEMWIYSESKSAMKLNKVSRQILATYCPFEKSIRESLKTNAPFAEAMMVQQKNFAEKAREWELRIRKRENNGLEVPTEFKNTYAYFANR